MRIAALLLIAVYLLTGISFPFPASCQSAPVSPPTPEIGGVSQPAASTPHAAGSPNVIVLPRPRRMMPVGEGAVFPPTRECAVAIEQALAQQASVSTSDPECAEEMSKALRLQQEDLSRNPPAEN